MGRIASIAIVFSLVGSSQAALVWKSTFDTNADGVVDVRNDNPGKVMIGANSGGRQEIVTMSRSVTQSDKSGRSIGATNLTATSSFGALYRWRYTGYQSAGTSGVEEFAGFVSAASTHCTRQFMGARLIHSVDSNNHYRVQFGAGWASVGYVGSGYLFPGASVDLGPVVPTGIDLQIAIGYNGATKVLTVALFDAAANVLKQASADIRTFSNLGVPPDDPALANEVDALSLSHLGWSDFIGAANGQTHTWSVDSLTYYDDPTTPFSDAGTPPNGACCQLDGTCALTSFANCNYQWQGANTACAQASCTAPTGACCTNLGTCQQTTLAGCTNGTWQGANTNCGDVICPPATGYCCLPSGSCAVLAEADCTGQGGTWGGAGSDCSQANCPQPQIGACCAPDGTCTSVTELNCPAGVWTSGANCGSFTCPVAPMGACCQPDGTCSQTLQVNCCGSWAGANTTCGGSCQPAGSLVWRSTFDTTADGVVDVRNDNTPKVMIGANTGGRQEIVTMSRSVTPADKAGRPLPAPVGASSSFSALYKFHYSGYQTAGTAGVEEFAGFISGSSLHCTRQFLGARLIHSLDANNHRRLKFGCGWGSDGYTYTGRQFQGPDLDLGPADPIGREYFIAIGYDGPSKNEFVALYDITSGSLLKLVGGDIQTFDNLGVSPGDPALNNELNALSLTHVGWSDFISDPGANGKTHTWSVDCLTYFNTADGAFTAGGISSPFIGACCHPDATCTDNVGAGVCDGTWRGPASTCALTLCPLPPCNNPFADIDADGDVDMNDFGMLQRCFTGPGNQYPRLQCHCFDRDNDNDIDINDYDKFVLCASGSGLPANPGCDGAP